MATYPAKRPCRKRGCSGLTTEKHGYCQAHAKLGSNWNNPTRGTAASRGYGHKWKKTRSFALRRDDGLCQVCLKKGLITLATAVDHIKPKSEGGTDEHYNLQSICDQCHTVKTFQESHKQRCGGGG